MPVHLFHPPVKGKVSEYQERITQHGQEGGNADQRHPEPESRDGYQDRVAGDERARDGFVEP